MTSHNKEYLSNCCNATITQADNNGHGKCSECGENCVPEIQEDNSCHFHSVIAATGLDPSSVAF